MKKLTARELEHLLEAAPAGEPPRGLAERIKSEIPDELPAPALPARAARPAWQVHRWRLAAALVMVVGGGSLAWWTIREAGSPEAMLVGKYAGDESGQREGTARPVGATGSPGAEADSQAAQPAPMPQTETPGAGAEDRDSAPAIGKELKALGYLDDRSSDEPPPRRAPPPAGRRLERREGAEQLEDEASPVARFRAPRAQQVPAPPRHEVQLENRRAEPGPQQLRRLEESRKRLEQELASGTDSTRADEPGAVAPAPEPEGPLYIASGEATAPPTQRSSDGKAFAAPGTTVGGQLFDSGWVRSEESTQSAAAPSTGGTDEPNDAPYGDVFYRHYGVNPFLDPEEDRLSTFALDADTGSWGVVRRYLSDGHLPPAEAVRVEEIVNALDYGDPAPAEDDFALIAEGAPTPFGGGDRYRLLRFAVQAREVDPADRKPAALTFVVDVSGSMAQEDRLGLVKRSLGLLLGELRPDDRVGLVIYGDRGRVVLEPTADREAIRAAIDALAPGGSTNAEEGLALGYEVASRALRPGAINRVILASDGVANVGATGPDSILARVRREAARGIELTTLGFGMGNYNDVLMERLADDGDGRYAYLDDLDEARRVLVEELTGTLQTVAEEARAQVEINPGLVERYRLIGYENRDLADERFRADTADAGEIGAGHAVTALYEVKLREQATGRAGERAYRNEPVATLRLRWRPDGAGEFVERERPLRLGELAGSWESAPPALRLAGLAAEFAELLRGSYWAREGSLDDVFRRLQALQPELPGDERAAELAAMAGKAARLGAAKAEPGGGR